ncbi:hypothetical protein [Candidatus Pelagibacter bacterium nBUS_29]|uniref:hypothetical protein n=1 Tax=Candidatus Pelagibacter bacterium nBUS_29 TaxID=3374190 RepID=UPI003EBA8983
MIEETNFETFLFISKNKYQIFVFDKNNLKNLYNEEIKINDGIELDNLSKFLNENIYKIEKTINSFIRNIILILEDDKVIDVSISIKKKDYEKNIDRKYLENTLVEVKDIFRENYQDQIIMHMIIINNDVNENKFLFNNPNINVDYSFLEVKFISISNSFTYMFDKLLENHQIKIGRYMSGNYIKSYIGDDATELSEMANKLNNGLNENEAQLVSKSIENKGFFEKFFQLFS